MEYIGYVLAFVVGIGGTIAFYKQFVDTVKGMGDAIPGEDPVEKFGQMLDEKVTPKMDYIADLIAKAEDMLNPLTHGGAGGTPEWSVPPSEPTPTIETEPDVATAGRVMTASDAPS